MPEDLATVPLTPVRIWNRGGARPVLAMHCSLAHGGAWSGLAERLHGVTIAALDQPGHGKAPDWNGLDDLHDLTTQIAVAMVEEVGQGGPVDLFGHSFGGTICLRIALERPDLVRSLMLVEPVIFAAAKGTPEYATFRAAHEHIAAVVKTDRAAGAALFHAAWGTGDALADLPDRAQQYITGRIHHIPAQNPVLLDDAAGLLRAGGLEAIAVPVLLVDGADSPPVIEAVHRALAARLAKVKRISVAGAGHMVPITHPDQVAKAVQAHLDAG